MGEVSGMSVIRFDDDNSDVVLVAIPRTLIGELPNLKYFMEEADCDDCGPLGYGWPSDEMKRGRNAVSDLIRILEAAAD